MKGACLSLQDRRGLDVNIVLWALWLGTHGMALDPVRLAEAEAVVAGFRREVVQALRAVRRHLRSIGKASSPSITADWPIELKRLGDRVAAAELDGEHLVQLALERLSERFDQDHPAGARLAVTNLSIINAFEDQDRPDLQTLIAQAFKDLSTSEVDGTLKGMGL